MGDLRIINGRVIDPSVERDETGAVVILNGTIADPAAGSVPSDLPTVDAQGAAVCPGFVDIHAHLRDPGEIHKEDMESGARAAAAGGYTTLVAMPDCSPAADNVGTIQQIRDRIEEWAIVNVLPTGCLTVGRNGERLANIGSFHRMGCVAITDSDRCVQDNEIMRRGLEYAKMFDLCVMDHCRDASLTRDAAMNEGEMSLRLGLKGWPCAAEDIIVSRNVTLSSLTGAHVHLQHISSSSSVDIIRRAKARGVRVTAEASPHHIHLTDAAVRGYDPNFKVDPPLRAEEDRRAVIQGLKDGVLDCVATDHAPQSLDDKDQEFDHAPPGVIGLESALPVVLDALYHNADASLKLSLPDVIGLLTHRAADVLRLSAGRLTSGSPGDVTIFDPDEAVTVGGRGFHSKSANCPWTGRMLRGAVKTTIVGGNVVYPFQS